MKRMSDDETPKVWHVQQEVILREWAEVASSYRWMHDRAFRIYKKQSLRFTIPVIILSTLTGTANFAQASFPENWQGYVPCVIGFLNITAGIVTTIQQFLRVNELQEGNRVASIAFGKYARNITVELNLPVEDRNTSGADFVRICRSEMDRLIEQSPIIPSEILEAYEEEYGDKEISKPEICELSSVTVYGGSEDRKAAIVAEAAKKMKSKLKFGVQEMREEVKIEEKKT